MRLRPKDGAALKPSRPRSRPKGTRGVFARVPQVVLLQAADRDPEEAGITLRAGPPRLPRAPP